MANPKRLTELSLPLVGGALEAIIVEGPGGEALIAERVALPDGVLFEARLPTGPRFYRLASEAGSVRAIDVTAEAAAAITARRAALRGAAAREQARRAARLKKLADDHYERTRHSFVFEGRELGFVKPTAETQAKLRADPLARMLAKGSLSADQVRAALEIRAVYRAISAGLFAKAQVVERTGRGRNEIAERTAFAHARRYLPWASYLGGRAATPEIQVPGVRVAEQAARPGTCPVAVEVTIDVVIDGKSLAEVERERHWRHAMAGEILRYALAVYAEIAGWERNGDLLAAFEAKWRRRSARAG